MLFHSLSLLLSPFTASTNNFQLIYANCKTAKQNVNLSNIRRSSRKKMIIICIVNKWILACVIHIINKCENKLFACFVCQFPSASHTHTQIQTHPYPYPCPRCIVMSNNCRSALVEIPSPLCLCQFVAKCDQVQNQINQKLCNKY